MTYQSTKTFGHNLGLSCAFRQWKADSHCHFLHGYALGVKLVFEAVALDARNWVVDFGSLKSLKQMLQDNFDHKTIVSKDDPQITMFRELHAAGVIDMVLVERAGCEAFAEMIGRYTQEIWLVDNGYTEEVTVRRHTGNSPGTGQPMMADYSEPRVRLVSCEVREHGANSAIWMP